MNRHRELHARRIATAALVTVFFLAIVAGVTTAATPLSIGQTKLLAPDGETHDFLGISVAIDGDTLVAGATGDDDAAFGAGAVYVFRRRVPGWWILQQKLTASDAAASDQPMLGYAVSVDGDTVAAGAWFADAPARRSGAVYVFDRSLGMWTEQQRLTPPIPEAGDHFGMTVAVDGDTLVAGAFNGRVFVFKRAGGVWSYEQLLTASDGHTSSFGEAVAVDGGTIFVGAGFHDGSGNDAGAVYVFEESGGAWTETQRLISSDVAPGDRFGQSVAIDGATAVIGAFGDDVHAINSGSAYVFTRSGPWAESAKLVPPDGARSDWFGYSVDLDAGLAAVGAGLDNAGGEDSGTVYLFGQDPGGWSLLDEMAASDPSPGDGLGLSVAISEEAIVAGARHRSDLGEDSGAVYVFEPGSDAANCGGLPVTITGTDGDDTIIGTAGPDVISALGGNDIVRGLNGHDIICGGPGNDHLNGGAGRDALWGESGDDDLRGGGGADVILGGSGVDALRGGAGHDELRGGDHGDFLAGNDGPDILAGGPGDDTLDGGRGFDDLDGGSGSDACRGGEIAVRCE